MITVSDYFGVKINHPDAKPEYIEAAKELLAFVNEFLTFAETEGIYSWPIDPDTGTCISGSKGGSGDGGFRLQSSKTGAINSRHRFGKAVDIFDPNDQLERFLNNEILEEFGLFREAPGSTPGWVHLQSVPPGSGNRTFFP